MTTNHDEQPLNISDIAHSAAPTIALEQVTGVGSELLSERLDHSYPLHQDDTNYHEAREPVDDTPTTMDVDEADELPEPLAFEQLDEMRQRLQTMGFSATSAEEGSETPLTKKETELASMVSPYLPCTSLLRAKYYDSFLNCSPLLSQTHVKSSPRLRLSPT